MLAAVYRRLVRVIYRHIKHLFVLLDVLLYFSCKAYIRRVPRAVGNNMRFYGSAYQCKIADNIKQLMPCRLIRKAKLKIVKIPPAFHLHFTSSKSFFKPLHFLIGNGLVYHYNGIIDIAAFNKVIVQEHFQLVQKTKSTTGRDLAFELRHVFQSCMLGPQHRAVEINKGGDLIFYRGHRHHVYPFFLIIIADIGIMGIP